LKLAFDNEFKVVWAAINQELRVVYERRALHLLVDLEPEPRQGHPVRVHRPLLQCRQATRDLRHPQSVQRHAIVFSSTWDKPKGATELDNCLDPGYFAVFLVKATDPTVVIQVIRSGRPRRPLDT